MDIYSLVLLDGTKFQIDQPAPGVGQVRTIHHDLSEPVVLVFGKDKTIHIPYHSVLYYIPL